MSGRWDHYDESAARIRPSKRGSRPRSKRRPEHQDAVIGRIVTVDRGRYRAHVSAEAADDGAPARVVTAVRAKELRRKPVVPGDRVSLVGDLSGQPGTLARLVKIQPRTTMLRRSADDTDEVERVIVANADQLLIVVAAANPEPRHGFVDRALAAAFDAGLDPLICVTKADLRDPEEFLAPYRHLQIPIVISHPVDDGSIDPGMSLPLDQDFLAEVQELLAGHITVLLGHSGVGKSTLVNALTGSTRATSHVNVVTGRGRHTSSSAQAIAIDDGVDDTWVIDTPGVRTLGLGHVPAENILAAFTDLVPATAECPRGCTHAAGAPGCMLDPWVAEGKAGPAGAQRLDSLRKLLLSRTDALEEGDDDAKELGTLG
ncbi:ribosome small subunit-dependent GTPase A [Micrococcoides hystricis]|uniref:Small ribosomal subunit biogenesis GTPase RsgA n=1 Tax=Micrococcoides hystricis TaxID=1572761 RepID=A0ABV6PBP6_9MICC